MGGSTLYDDDILLWSEQQAAALRRLRDGPRGLPNELDIDNVAEEIESVGRSELAAVESYVELILVHLIKLAAAPDEEPVRHCRAEVTAFHSGFRRRFASSMRARIDLAALWADARAQVAIGGDGAERTVVGALPEACPVTLDDLLVPRLDVEGLERRLRDLCSGGHRS